MPIRSDKMAFIQKWRRISLEISRAIVCVQCTHKSNLLSHGSTYEYIEKKWLNCMSNPFGIWFQFILTTSSFFSFLFSFVVSLIYLFTYGQSHITNANLFEINFETSRLYSRIFVKQICVIFIFIMYWSSVIKKSKWFSRGGGVGGGDDDIMLSYSQTYHQLLTR